MSLPPAIIRIKRKRDEEEPVTFLQLDSSTKRPRSGSDWVYQRKTARVTITENILSPLKSPRSVSTPVVRTPPLATAPAIPRSNSPPPDHAFKQAGVPDTKPAVPTALGKRPDTTSESATKASSGFAQTVQQRRFHISRSALKAARGTRTPPETSGLRKKRRDRSEVIFVERRVERIRRIYGHPDASTAHSPADGPAEPKLKKPGRTARIKKPSTQQDGKPPVPGAAPVAAPLPEYTADMERYAAEMDQWTLNEMSRNFAKVEADSNRTPAKPAASPLRFKPKPPAKRYFERHPEDAARAKAAAEDDANLSDASGDDWIMEEYERVPAAALDSTVPIDSVGLLVIGDEEEEQEYFYGDEEPSDNEMPDDEDDENAEDYYGADYPEDEVDPDDEFDRDAYRFRDNPSDEEEYDMHAYINSDGSDGNGDSDDDYVVEGDDEDATIRKIHKFMMMRQNQPRTDDGDEMEL